MASPAETRLLARLLKDAAFRERFRADPEEAAREADIELPEGFAAGESRKTLDGRESKSSFAGALMAAAVEGIGLFELGQHVFTGAEDAHAATTPASAHVDPAEYGETGTGGPPSPETLDLLHNHNVAFDADGIADLNAGKVDPRVVSVLEDISKQHRISISALVSDHSKLTTGGTVSNHYYGRAVDISMVDGRPVGPGNLAARRIAVALLKLPASVRPTEIGSPWHLAGAAYFTNAEHQNHLHIGFDDPISRNWEPPPGASEPAAPVAVEPAPLPASEPVASSDAAEAAAIVKNAANPDDLQGNLDDEDAGADEQDGSNEDEPDEDGGDDGGDDDGGDDDGGDDSGDPTGDDGNDSADDGQDAPGEGSNGEDATDDNANGSNGGDSSDGSDSSPVGSSGSGSGDSTPSLEGVDSTYPGDSAPRTQIAAWMAAAAEKRGLPPELPVMAGLVESGLHNLDYGDRDSIGFFQMRTSIWDEGPYAGYEKHPEKQLDWFLDQAEKVKQQRLARGQSVGDANQYGDWIADIERPAAQYRGRYQLRLEEARSLLGKR
jgi:hypothetical protein